VASAKVRSQANQYEASVWRNKAEWRRWERVGMKPSMDLNDLKLRWVSDKAKDLAVKGAIVSLSFTRSIEQASTVTMTLRDPHKHIFSEAGKRMRNTMKDKSKQAKEPLTVAWKPIDAPSLIGRALDIELDGVPFRLTKVEYTHSNEEAVLTFEDRAIYWLRRKGGKPKRVSRADSTRAEFILNLVREVKQETIPFVCPELHKKQKIARAESGAG